MISLASLWLPILLAAVVVFVASSVIHMATSWHKDDYRPLPDEDGVLESLRPHSIPPGDYVFPFARGAKEMGSPEMLEKYRNGPVGITTILPNGPPAMAGSLLWWFVFCVLIGGFAAYIAAFALPKGAHYLEVFRVVGTVAFLGYGGAHVTNSMWKGQSWAMNVRHTLDGLVYGLLTAGVFGWLWPPG